uniref:Serpentine receptor class gamma n=1 Tax=Panagrolaimus davidi TaxID=227884 RepID=A0A914R7Y7_9BILA
MFTVTNTTFGRVSLNISQSFSYGLANATSYANIFGVAYELSVIIFFLVSFCNRKSHFRVPYFIIYTFGCIVDVLPKFITLMFKYVSNSIIFFYPAYGIRFYNGNFIYLWNLILAINRFSAILFSIRYNSIWSKKNTTIICIFLGIYPFLIHAFNYEYMWCQITYLDCFKQRRNVTYTDFEEVFGYISDITYAILATIFGISAALSMLSRNSARKNHPEKVLLVQSILSSVFLLGSTLTSWLGSVNGILMTETAMNDENMRALYLQTFFNVTSQSLYGIHHYLGLILLLIMSKGFRNSYLQFYGLKSVTERVTKMVKSDSVSGITVISSSSLKKPNLF